MTPTDPCAGGRFLLSCHLPLSIIAANLTANLVVSYKSTIILTPLLKLWQFSDSCTNEQNDLCRLIVHNFSCDGGLG